MKRATPDLIVCRYAKARHEKLVQLTETAGEITRTGDPNCASGAPKFSTGASQPRNRLTAIVFLIL